jgi:hypothetical protein
LLSWNIRATSKWGYEGLQPLAATVQLEDKVYPGGCSVVDDSKMDAASQTARTPGWLCWIMRWSCGKDLQHQIIEESPLGKYRFRKEFNCIRKDLIIPVVLGVVRGLSIPYIKMTCIYFWIKQ